MGILDDYDDDSEIRENPIPARLDKLSQSKLKKLLAEHEERVDDWNYFNSLNPENPSYSKEQIKAYEKDIATLREMLGKSAPIPETPIYRELSEYRWQEEILSLKDLIKVVQKQVDHVRYYGRNNTEARRLEGRKVELEDQVSYLGHQIERIGELREALARSEEESYSKGHKDRYRAEINNVIRDVNLNFENINVAEIEYPKAIEVEEEVLEEEEKEEVVEINLPFDPSDSKAVKAYLNPLPLEEIVEFAKAIGMDRISRQKTNLIFDIVDYLEFEYEG
jgi:hypothetical protein